MTSMKPFHAVSRLQGRAFSGIRKCLHTSPIQLLLMNLYIHVRVTLLKNADAYEMLILEKH